MKAALKVPLLFAAVLGTAVCVCAQGTAFQYQGRLNYGGNPATGLYDLRFTIYDSVGGATVVAGPQTISGTGVTNGVFTVTLDFGAGVFTGPARWLEIGVRPNGGASYTNLSPRQPLLPTPYAIHAGTASNVANGSVVRSLNNLRDNVTLAAGANVTLTPSGNTLTIASAGGVGSGPWSLNGGSAYYNGGNVGIGTTTPARKLTVRTPTTDYGIEHTDGDVRLSTYVGGSTGGGWLGTVSNHKLSFFVNDGSASMTVDTTGNVGIGTVSPFAKLDVFGDQMLWGKLNFGNGLRQTLDLFGQGFGIGIQTANVYFRSGSGFAWHVGGVHNDNTYNSGGGTTLLTLDPLGMSFGARLGQHIRLWTDDAAVRYFGFGIQGETLYSRVGSGAGDGFAWYKGGFHDDGHRNPGGGKKLMTLDEETGLFVDGLTSVRALTIRGGADLAEPFPMEAAIEKGSVMVIDKDHPGRLKRSTQAYDKRVAGIVSGANGIRPGIALKQEGVLDQGENVALTGRVYVLADASNGSIEPGDLLTTSATPGHAMKAADHARAQGAVLGKAMSSLNEGRGTVLVLVTLQ